MSYIISFLPLATLLILATATRRMSESMIASTMLALLLLHKTNFVHGMVDSFYQTLADSTFHFCVLVVFCFGIAVKLFQESGGLLGFAEFMKKLIKGPRSALLLSWLISSVLFVDEYLNVLTVGFSMSRISDQNGIPREHLAMQIHLMACSLCIVIPLTSWTAFTISLIEPYGLGLTDYIHGIPLIIFPLMTIILCLLLAIGILPKAGNLKQAYQRIQAGGPALPSDKHEKPLIDLGELDENKVSSPLNLFIPLFFAIGGTIYFDNNLAIGMILTIMSQFILYIPQKIISPGAFFDHFFAGASSMLTIIIVIFFGFTLSSANKDLGLFDHVISLVGSTIPAPFIPALVFLIVAFCVFASGSCWVVMLITMPIFLPLAASMGISQVLTLAALMSGVTAGYTLCFYADTVLMTMASTGVSNMTIIKTVMPYSVIMMILSTAAYVALGFAM